MLLVDKHSACMSSQAICVLKACQCVIFAGRPDLEAKVTAPFGCAFIDDYVLYVAGNLMVILVVTFSRRLRSITNFFLANLAVADLCVGVFCVYQNLSTYVVSK
jgi:hypothetical protein